MFLHVIDDTRRSVLNIILDNQPVKDMYLAGGTALALQIGHRESIDFDWFTSYDFNPVEIERSLGKTGEFLVTESKRNTFHGFLNGVQITFLHYQSPMLSSFVVPDSYPTLKISSILDIGLMKLIAVSQRGAKKDFIDLYAIHKNGVSLTLLFQKLPEKYPNTKLNLYHIVKSLHYFEDAEQEPMPRMLVDWNWADIKDFFTDQQHLLWKVIQK